MQNTTSDVEASFVNQSLKEANRYESSSDETGISQPEKWMECAGDVVPNASSTVVDPCAEMCMNGERLIDQEKVLGEWVSDKRKKGAVKKNKENHLQVPTLENGYLVLEGTSIPTADPAIPPGFESQNRFHGFEEEEKDISTSQLVLEDPMVSIAKASSSKPSKGIGKKLSSKSKYTGMLPNGNLSSLKMKKPPKSKVPNKVSAVKFLDFGSSWGLEFPLQKTNREKMFKDLAKNHDDLIIENVDVAN